MNIQPYLFFDGRCEEAIEFYRKAIGAEVVMLMRHRDSPQPPPENLLPPGSEDKIMHAELRIGEAVVMASDGYCRQQTAFQGFSLALTVASAADVDRCFEALAEGGAVTMPLERTFWSPRAGMLTDRFGIGWVVQTP